jgi:hypothetical protein
MISVVTVVIEWGTNSKQTELSKTNFNRCV